MAKELIYTSAPRGLFPGTSGFCTVQASAGIARPVIEMLESLSNHFRVPASASGTGIVAISCLRARVGMSDIRVISRNAAAPADYSGRSNNLAHHLVIEGNEVPPVRNAAALAQMPGLLTKQWDGHVLTLPPRKIPGIPAPDASARSWKEVTGDAGWARHLANLWLTDEGPLHLIYDPKIDLLPLLAEAIEQIPESRRAETTFTTYYSGLPLGVTCQLRGVLVGSEQEGSARKQRHLVLADLVGKPSPEIKIAAATPPAIDAEHTLASPVLSRSVSDLNVTTDERTARPEPPRMRWQRVILAPFRPSVFKVMAAAIIASTLVNIGLGVMLSLPAREVAEVRRTLEEEAEKKLQKKEDERIKAVNEKKQLEREKQGVKLKAEMEKNDLEAKIRKNRSDSFLNELHAMKIEFQYQRISQELASEKNKHAAVVKVADPSQRKIEGLTIPFGRLIFMPEMTVVESVTDKGKTTSKVRLFFKSEPAIPIISMSRMDFVEFSSDGTTRYPDVMKSRIKDYQMHSRSEGELFEVYLTHNDDFKDKKDKMNQICKGLLDGKLLQLSDKYNANIKQQDIKNILDKAYYYNKFDFSNLK